MRKIVVAVAALTFSSVAFTAPYIGVEYGAGKINYTKHWVRRHAVPKSTVSKVKSGGLMPAILAGYTFEHGLGVEGIYTYAPTSKFEKFSQGKASLRAYTQTYDVLGTYSLPVYKNVLVTAKAGESLVHRNDTRQLKGYTKDSFVPAVALQATYKVTPAIGVFGEYRYHFARHDMPSMRTAFVGVSYLFGVKKPVKC